MPVDTIENVDNTNETTSGQDDAQVVEQPQLLEMSDEDFAKLNAPPTEEASTEAGGEAGTDNEPAADADPDGAADNNAAGSTAGKVDAVPEKDAAGKDAEAGKDQAAVDYKAEYEKLLAPFKANGGEIQVKSTDEILTLMQMGANYHKKMTSIKPALRVVKLLEKNGLLDENKLNHLIDISKKDPAAIRQMIKDSGINPLDIDVTDDVAYTPQSHQVADAEIALDEVLDDIKSTPTYARTLNVVTSEWDKNSQGTIVANPHIIRVLNGHIGDGTFDKIMTEVNRARSFGQLQGIPDLDAYKQMGDYMHSNGLLNPVANAPAAENDAEAALKKVDDDQKRKARRKAAGAPPQQKPASEAKPKDILGLSDEEFLKLPPSAYTKIR